MNEQRKKYLQQCTMAMLSAFLLLLSGCGSAAPTEELPETPVAMVQGKDFCLRGSDGSYTPAFLNGVNIGASKPGYFPGEFGITEDDYLRWFQQISDMHVQVIRVYVGQMPAFYDALEKFNRRAEQPLSLIHICTRPLCCYLAGWRCSPCCGAMRQERGCAKCWQAV